MTLTKNLWHKWFPQDVQSDICYRRMSLAARGAWRDALDLMMCSRSYELTMTMPEWARCWGVTEDVAREVIAEIRKHRTAEYRERNGLVTLKNRRLEREAIKREKGRIRKARHDGNARSNAPVTKKSAPNNGEKQKQKQKQKQITTSKTTTPAAPAAPVAAVARVSLNGGHVWGWWVEANRSAGRQDPSRLGPDTQAGKTIAGLGHDEPTVKHVLAAYLADDDQFLAKQGHPLRLLLGRFDRYRNGSLQDGALLSPEEGARNFMASPEFKAWAEDLEREKAQVQP